VIHTYQNLNYFYWRQTVFINIITEDILQHKGTTSQKEIRETKIELRLATEQFLSLAILTF
jgi:hypothetical protein